ncbi:heavy-metal-associated domain-containing protein [Bacteroidota bacterium]
MKTIIVLLSLMLLSSGASAQNSKLEVIKIKTSSQCDMCKERIEEALAFEKGVKKSVVDVEKQIVTVTYKKGKTDPDKIRKAISKTGYDADDVLADSKAYAKLDACCKKPEDPDSEDH